MILNRRQRTVTQQKLDKLNDHLEMVLAKKKENVSRLQRAKMDGIRSQIRDLEQEITRFDDLSSGRITTRSVESLGDLSIALIEARIAASLTQRQLGEMLGIDERQIQRYEANRWAGAGLERLSEVADKLGLKLNGVIYSPNRATG